MFPTYWPIRATWKFWVGKQQTNILLGLPKGNNLLMKSNVVIFFLFYFTFTFNTEIELAHEILVLTTMETSEGSGEPAHPRSLAKTFAVRSHKVWK